MDNRKQFEDWYDQNNILAFPNVEEFAWEVWQAARRWIDITEELPPDDSNVLIIVDGIEYRAYVQDGLFLTDTGETFLVDDISFWFPQPEKPAEED